MNTHRVISELPNGMRCHGSPTTHQTAREWAAWGMTETPHIRHWIALVKPKGRKA